MLESLTPYKPYQPGDAHPCAQHPLLAHAFVQFYRTILGGRAHEGGKAQRRGDDGRAACDSHETKTSGAITTRSSSCWSAPPHPAGCPQARRPASHGQGQHVKGARGARVVACSIMHLTPVVASAVSPLRHVNAPPSVNIMGWSCSSSSSISECCFTRTRKADDRPGTCATWL